jgi:uncharacterized protein
MAEQENVQVVKDFFAALGGGDQPAALALAAEDIEWVVPGRNWPLAGTRRGHRGLQDLFRTGAETVETSVMEPREFVAQGDRVVVIGVARGKILATTKSWVDEWAFAITVQDGKLTNIREYIDTQALAEASATEAGAGPLSDENDLAETAAAGRGL